MSTRQSVLAIALLWLAGIGLRITILAVPPVIALIQADLKLSGTEIGILNGLPVVLFAAVAIPGSLLIARFGAVTALVIGLLLTGVGSALRGASDTVAILFVTTVLTGAGVAIMQPAMPPVVRQWLPKRIGFGTAVYTNGLLVGETLPVAFTLLLVLPLVGSWRWGFVVWGVPCILIAFAILLFAPRAKKSAAEAAAPKRWWPDWRDGMIWRLGFLLSSCNASYFCVNAFLPGYLTEASRPDLIGPALTALNVGQLPASFVLLAVAGRLERRVWPFMVTGFLCVASVIGIVFTANAWTVAFATVLGFSTAAVLALALALPPLLSAPADVARVSAAMFTISYGLAMVVSVAAGVTWDLTGSAAWAFLPIVFSGLPLLLIAPTIDFHRRPAAH
jgi:CP family cyanate transporter-like MFS transporter